MLPDRTASIKGTAHAGEQTLNSFMTATTEGKVAPLIRVLFADERSTRRTLWAGVFASAGLLYWPGIVLHGFLPHAVKLDWLLPSSLLVVPLAFVALASCLVAPVLLPWKWYWRLLGMIIATLGYGTSWLGSVFIGICLGGIQ